MAHALMRLFYSFAKYIHTRCTHTHSAHKLTSSPSYHRPFLIVIALTLQTLVVALREEQHRLGGTLGRLQQSLPVWILSEAAQHHAIGARHVGQQRLARRRLVVELQVMVERAVLVAWWGVWTIRVYVFCVCYVLSVASNPCRHRTKTRL